MNVNSISVLLGCVGLTVGSLGLVAQDIRDGNRLPAVDMQQRVRASAWPPSSLAANVEFHDEMLALAQLGPQPRRRPDIGRQEAQAAPPVKITPPDSGISIRLVRTVRAPGSRRAQAVEIEFTDQNGRSYRQVYLVDRQIFVAGDRIEESEPDRRAFESYAASPRRSRRSYRRSWWW